MCFTCTQVLFKVSHSEAASQLHHAKALAERWQASYMEVTFIVQSLLAFGHQAYQLPPTQSVTPVQTWTRTGTNVSESRCVRK